jgi:sigma-B regulation protein RsbU (phosphoserine phosphatase)
MTAPPSTILIVDDHATNLQVLARTLQGTGHRILAAKDGRAALDIARAAHPDLILLDVMMPGMDGFEVCRALKDEHALRDTVVIFLSALGDVADKVSGLNLGAVDYITKPIQAEEVLARVASHLSRQHLERQLRESRDSLTRELDKAARMQQLILPPALPIDSAVEFAAFYQTSRHAGGDYYDVLPLGDRRFAIMVADVSGHGAPAAIIMAMIRAVLHAHPGLPDDPPAVMHYINRHFTYLWDTAMFATAVFAVVDLERMSLRVSCAGHPPPLLMQRGGGVASISVTSTMPLLFMELGDVPSVELPLAPGDRVLFYTDGITERQTSSSDDMYDVERLASAMAEAGDAGPRAAVSRIVAGVEAFAAGHEPDDDQTLLLMAISGRRK